MHFTILALGSRGDVAPYIALGAGLVSAGHAARFITFAEYASQVRQAHMDFHPIQGDPQALVANAGTDMLALMRSFGSLAEGYAQDLPALHLGETDMILNQLPAGLYGVDLAEKYGVAMVQVGVIPLARTSTFPLMGFPRLKLPAYNRATYTLGEQMAWQMFRKVINRWREKTLNLPPHPVRGYFDQLGTSQHPVLNGFSQHVVPRPVDWGEHIHTTGYWFPEDREWQPPDELLAFLDAGTPPVFIGFGSMPVKDPEAATKMILDALERTGQRAILHAGWAGLGKILTPDAVHLMTYAPYAWLFPRMAMVIHHGGSGTTAAGFRAGVPACVVSFVFDQHYWGERIASLGAGPAPVRFKFLTAKRLGEVIETGTGDVKMRQKAAALGILIRAEDGIGNAIKTLENLRNV